MRIATFEVEQIIARLASLGDDTAKRLGRAQFAVSMGDVLRARSFFNRAYSAYGKALDIVERLAHDDPGNVDWQRLLFEAHKRMGDALGHRTIGSELGNTGDKEAARTTYHKSLAIVEKLDGDPTGDAEWQIDVSVRYEEIGGALYIVGDLKGALDCYQRCWEIRETILADALAGDTASISLIDRITWAVWDRNFLLTTKRLEEIRHEIANSNYQGYTGDHPPSSSADDTPQKGMGDHFDIGDSIGARLLRELSPTQLARVLENTTLARLMARYEDGLAELDVERESFASKEQADAAANVAVTLRRLQKLQGELRLPITETPEQVQKGEAMAAKFRRTHDETGDPIPSRPRGRPRGVSQSEMDAAASETTARATDTPRPDDAATVRALAGLEHLQKEFSASSDKPEAERARIARRFVSAFERAQRRGDAVDAEIVRGARRFLTGYNRRQRDAKRAASLTA